ncbi:MAG: GGDEF domain-containing protein [Pseudohongiellaceae bacterium]|nr:GGDEF domain-containing protein [Pseudohongiellaceae bacterium]
MATPMQNSNTIDFNSARVSLSRSTSAPDPSPLENFGERRYRMSASLQSTLDIEKLLQIFRQELDPYMHIQGLQYINEGLQLKHNIGKKASHSCGYRLITSEDHLGEIIFYHTRRFSDQDLEAIEVMLGALVCPLRNALQYRDALMASLTDPLTGAGNRVALSNTLDREISLARRHKHELSILVMDLDKFKAINDQFGHSAGDQVLKEVVALLKKSNRNTDLTYRFGGEEFVLLLNRTDEEGALVIAERLRSAIEDMEIVYDSQSIKTTVSIGVTAFCETDSPDSLFNRADKALYEIKRNGGNQVIAL